MLRARPVGDDRTPRSGAGRAVARPGALPGHAPAGTGHHGLRAAGTTIERGPDGAVAGFRAGGAGVPVGRAQWRRARLGGGFSRRVFAGGLAGRGGRHRPRPGARFPGQRCADALGGGLSRGRARFTQFHERAARAGCGQAGDRAQGASRRSVAAPRPDPFRRPVRIGCHLQCGAAPGRCASDPPVHADVHRRAHPGLDQRTAGAAAGRAGQRQWAWCAGGRSGLVPAVEPAAPVAGDPRHAGAGAARTYPGQSSEPGRRRERRRFRRSARRSGRRPRARRHIGDAGAVQRHRRRGHRSG